ncbi:MAG: DUF2203 domain-containing protein [Gemmatimonadota bacterium]|nr:DUF2203 domain-containing protein [Gemmatimonadota bacterium]
MNEVRYFTPLEANRALPLVKRIVADIQTSGRRLRQLAGELGPAAADNAEVRKLIASLNEFFEELEGIGCSYKDPNFSLGLVDFPGVIDGEEVLLCWRSDEPAVTHYHGPTEGYQGRKRIPDELLRETGTDQREEQEDDSSGTRKPVSGDPGRSAR